MNTVYEKNMELLQETRPDLYEGLKKYNCEEQKVYVGDALDGEHFLAYVNGENVTPLNSTYHPAHEAACFVEQYEDNAFEYSFFQFGFGDGQVIRNLLSNPEKNIEKYIVYEPCIEIFLRAVETFELTDLICETKLLIAVEGINADKLEHTFYTEINYRNWKYFRGHILSKYDVLFAEKCQQIVALFTRMRSDKHGEMNSLKMFAEAGISNEIKALTWMIDSRVVFDLTGRFSEDFPCIVVAAGPSLEKNVEVLKQAKGRAFILCVDTAIDFLLKHGVMPDMTCTIDPKKGPSYFTNPAVKNMPIAISTDSDCRSLEQIGEVNPYYLSITNDYYQSLYKKQGREIGFFDGGGSVGTVCFQLAVDLGFKNIIIIGQDLAFTGSKAHAGKGQATEQDLFYGMMMVDAYDGGKVMTRADFKYYIDWYNMRISEVKEGRNIINATEGGAKLQGAAQMTLQEAVDTYCKEECDVATVLENIPRVWDTREKQEEYYTEIKNKMLYFSGFSRRIKDGLNDVERAIYLLKRGNYHPSELHKIDKKIDYITREVSEEDGIVILIKRMIGTELELADDIPDAEENLELESIRLYGKMKKYLSDMQDALAELIPMWNEAIKTINEKYHFE